MKTESRIASFLGLLLTIPTIIRIQWKMFLRITLPLGIAVALLAFPLAYLIPAYFFGDLSHLEEHAGLTTLRLICGGIVFAAVMVLLIHSVLFFWFYLCRGFKILLGKHFTVEEFRSLRRDALRYEPLFPSWVYLRKWRFEQWCENTRDYLRSLNENS